VIAVNLTAIFLLSKHVVPYMEASGGGAIVNMSSVQAQRDAARCRRLHRHEGGRDFDDARHGD